MSYMKQTIDLEKQQLIEEISRLEKENEEKKALVQQLRKNYLKLLAETNEQRR